jgi:hypothetical protein
MARSRFAFPILLLFTVLLAASSRANDTLVTLAAGGLVPIKSSSIVMESEKLQITVHRISVDYVFRNTSNQDIDAVVAFPLPELDGATLEVSPIELPSKDPTNFVSFKLTVDGKAISPKVEIRAFKKDDDITERLKSLGLPVSVLDPRMKAAIGKLPKAQLSQLQEEEVIVDEAMQTAGKGDERFWPWWQTRIQFYWTQHFRANSTVRVSHTYAPVVGGSYIDDDGSYIAERYCGTAASLQHIKELKAKLPKGEVPESILWWRSLGYILTTANNWNGPIRHFHLEIDSDAPDNVLLTCMPSIKKSSGTHYELDASDFRPGRNLDLVIIQPDKRKPVWPSTQ